MDNATTGVVLVLAKNDEGVFKYQSLSNWHGFSFRTKEWGGASIAFASLNAVT